MEFTNYQEQIYRKNAQRTREDLRKALSIPDRRIIQSVEAIEELDENLNVVAERLREWYSLYFPEASFTIKSHETFAKLISKSNNRNDFKDKLGEEAKETIGAEFSEKDLSTLRNFAKNLTDSYSAKENLEIYLKDLIQKSFPNLNEVATPLVGAKLISLAGDSERLSRMPSSTVQVLGAEKALFRHLKTGAKPPKYGAILSHPLLKSAQKKFKGKIARAIAGKISIAIRRDVFGGDFMGKELRNDLEEKVRGILKK